MRTIAKDEIGTPLRFPTERESSVPRDDSVFWVSSTHDQYFQLTAHGSDSDALGRVKGADNVKWRKEAARPVTLTTEVAVTSRIPPAKYIFCECTRERERRSGIDFGSLVGVGISAPTCFLDFCVTLFCNTLSCYLSLTLSFFGTRQQGFCQVFRPWLLTVFGVRKKTTMYLQMLFIHNVENIKADKVVWQWKTRTKFKLAETVLTLLAGNKLVHKLDDSFTTPAAEWQADEALS